MAHSPRVDTTDERQSKDKMSDLVTNGMLPEFLEILNSVAQDELDDLKRRYAAFIIQIDRLRAGLERLDHSSHPDEVTWSICETLGHLIDTDRDIWWPRIEATRSEDRPHFPNIDQHDLVRKHNWRSQPIEDILSQLVRARWQYGMQLNSIPEDEFERMATHEVLGEISILRMLQIMVAHDEFYLAKIRALLRNEREFPE